LIICWRIVFFINMSMLKVIVFQPKL